MCGINGFNWQDEELVNKMNKKIKHRGPDDEGIFILPNISLGQTRLSIIDLSEKGHQPMNDSSGRYTIIYNGELYNFKELRKSLKGKYPFHSDSDTEVVLYSFLEWGPKCLEYFNGIFAFAIWDNIKEELFLARDRMGVKPLYYYYDGKRFIFSSEIKAILEHGISREVCDSARELYFNLLYVPGPLTMFKGIKKLLPAQYLVFKNNTILLKKYWQINNFNDYSLFNDAKKDIRSIFEDSVKRQLISDRPVGIFLSGGIDSTAVLGAAAKYMSGKINTYSVGFEVDVDSEKFNADFKLARETAKFYNTEHHELVISGRDVLENIERAIYHMDEPVANLTEVAIMLLAREAKRDVAVVLGGDGGDELFGGYPRHYYSYLISRYQKLLKTGLRPKLSGLLETYLKRKNLKEKLESPAGVERWSQFLFQKEAMQSAILKEHNTLGSLNYLEEYYFAQYKDRANNDFEKIFMLVDAQNWLVDESLLRTDKMTMAYGLEQRVPILDYRLAELSARIPTKWKVGNSNQGKRIWKEAIGDFLPQTVKKYPKHGFFSPGAKWLRTDLREFTEEIFRGLDSETYHRDNTLKILKEHIEMKKYNLNLIWAIVTFESWKKKYNIN